MPSTQPNVCTHLEAYSGDKSIRGRYGAISDISRCTADNCKWNDDNTKCLWKQYSKPIVGQMCQNFINMEVAFNAEDNYTPDSCDFLCKLHPSCVDFVLQYDESHIFKKCLLFRKGCVLVGSTGSDYYHSFTSSEV